MTIPKNKFEKINNLEKNPFSINDKIVKELELRGLSFDSETIIDIHEENNMVNFTCLNCITRELESNEKVESAWNGRSL